MSTVAIGVRKGGIYEQVIGTAGEFYDPFAALNSVGGVGDVGDALPWFDMKDKLAELAEGHCALLRKRDALLVRGTRADSGSSGLQPRADWQAELIKGGLSDVDAQAFL